jgi:hypothetical protein
MTVNVTNTVGANNTIVLDGSSKIPAFDGSLVTALDADVFTTGSLAIARIDVGTTAGKILQLDSNAKIPAISGVNLTNAPGATVSTSDPTISSNLTLGKKWVNKTSGEVYICTDATAGANVWTNVGAGTGDVKPANFWGGRGVQMGGHYPTVNNIQYITIATTGNATDFGDLVGAKRGSGGFSNGADGRGCDVGSDASSGQGNTASHPGVEYITFATTGNATFFGNLVIGGYQVGDGGNGIRGLKIGGQGGTPYYNPSIDYVTIANTGNATDFGDMSVGGSGASGVMDGTYCRYGGFTTGAYLNNIETVTVATAGNAADWADMTVSKMGRGCVSSEAGRGVWWGGSPTITNICDYVTIATQANAVDFGDLTQAGEQLAGCMNATRGVATGRATPSLSDVLDYITIATTGNATDFGNLNISRYMSGACSGD